MNRSFLRKPEEINLELTKLFKDNGFEVSWDSDRNFEWLEVYENNKMIMQIESNVTVEKFINLLVKDYEARQKNIFIDPGFFIASNIFDDDNRILDFSNKFELFKNKINYDRK